MPTPSLPRSLADLLIVFSPRFTAPTFRTFCVLVAGFLAQPGRRTVTGMLAGARLAGRWHHARAHRFFAATRWSPDALGLALLDLIATRLLDRQAPLHLVIDDTLFRRSGRKVWGTAWHHDPLARARKQVASANSWVVLGVLVRLPFLPQRGVCLPVLARLWRPHQPGRSKLDLACALVGLVAQRHPDRRIHLVCDAAYAGRALRQLPPPRTGRPRTKGDRLPELTVLAALVRVRWQQATVRCYDRGQVVALACWRCLWYGAFGRQPVQVVLVRPPGRVDGYDVALVSTDLVATPAELVERYADRWSVEVGFEEARQVAGVRQARNRTRLAVERTVPFGLVCLSLTVVWYALHGQPAVDIAARRAAAPWYQTKHAPSVADMLAAIRRVLIAAQFRPSRLVEPTHEEILAVQHAWATAAA
jgi:hypothetical protein